MKKKRKKESWIKYKFNNYSVKFKLNKHGVGVEPTKIRSAGERSTVVPPVHKNQKGLCPRQDLNLRPTT